ncbi:helix-turn-helix domain-containing protein [Aureimonas sp. AU40]|uniref:helix-turn-helix domain-containing protein n=1 Tax=Aureimonas sp. AU40 TaxID=1637747 RepID=UPI0007831216|nr:helix-turn-helix transcriptional regulator [Aureimonas sp. AU40]
MSNDPIDIHLGKRIERRRLDQGRSLQSVAEDLGITYQQVRKYENGENRVSASTLYRLATALDVPTSFFFEGMEGEPLDEGNPEKEAVLEPAVEDMLSRIRDPEIRRAIRHLFVRMANLRSR